MKSTARIRQQRHLQVLLHFNLVTVLIAFRLITPKRNLRNHVLKQRNCNSYMLPKSWQTKPSECCSGSLYQLSRNKASSSEETTNQEDGNDKTTNRIEEESKPDQEFSAWIEGLGQQWPLAPNKVTGNLATVFNNKENTIPESSFSNSSRTVGPDAVDSLAASRSSATNQTNTSSDKDKSSPKETFLSLPPVPLLPRQQQQQQQQPSTKPSSTSPRRYGGRMNPLTNFIQLEAILDLAAAVTNDTEPYFNSVFAAVDQLFKYSKQQQQQQWERGVNTSTQPQTDAPEKIDDVVEVSNITTVEELLGQKPQVGNLPFLSFDKFWSFTAIKEEKESTATSKAMVDTLLAIVDQEAPIQIPSNFSSSGLAQVAETMLKDTTTRIEELVSDASHTLLSPSKVQELLLRASRVFGGISTTTTTLNSVTTISSLPSNNNTTVTNITTTTTSPSQLEMVSNEIVRAAKKVAKESGVDVQFAADRAREATNFAASIATVANIVLGSGYAYGSRSGASGIEGYPLYEVIPQVTPQQATTPPLLAAYQTARRIEPFQYENVVIKGAEMGVLAGGIYEDTIQRCHKLGHAMVANGKTANVAWMVTDSIDYESRYKDGTEDFDYKSLKTGEESIFIRTITIRGFDASDDSIDREALLNDICKASPVPLDEETANKVLFHSGLLSIARQVYSDIQQYIDWTPPRHKIVFNGHSVGGSLSILILLLLVNERGVDFVRQRIQRVYTHGSPPVAAAINEITNDGQCPILTAFELPSDIVYGFVQPYDPVVRLFTDYDALYPLVDDLGADEITLYASGPRRSLRPIARAIFASWEGWPRFRENWKGSNQSYQSVGTQHLLLPEPLRYLNDRFFSVNVGVPPVEAIVRVSSTELLPILNTVFPLDVFQISLIPQAVRSFLHHFYPAYDSSIADYAAKVTKLSRESMRKNIIESNKRSASIAAEKASASSTFG